MNAPGTILVATADRAFKAVVGTALQADGHRVLHVTDAAAALATYADQHPDLVLLDVDLPDRPGLDACEALIASQGAECAPIIFFATHTTPEQIASGLAAGAADYLAKAATTDEVRARVRSHLQSHMLLKEQIAIAEQLARANTAKNRFIGMAAHDMRNPLASIRGFAEFLMDGTMGPMPPSQLALVSIIHGTANIMIKTLNELLDVATIEAGQLKLQVSAHTFTELVTKSITQARIEARKKRTRIELTVPDASPVLSMDGDKMKQVVDNLLSNAIKFSPAAAVISVRIETTDDDCTVVVRDQGPGLPDGIRQRFFGAGSRAPFEAAEGEKSAGIGLIICRNIVRAHRGTLTATNLPDRGCEIRMSLPRHAAVEGTAFE